ncbi:thioester reductase domain-containing protein [Saccharopolyspora antimicrobica]|uniref:Thioester reductase domain-containing protein n=1 Tax=Saccharopolyspora antimicrobica TaxID=455193 RepID=A0A1I5C3Q9_9PSEU|nr:thioester reductase domain-containing protein [Saccharopolyspora antimicrobica]RKT88990.1 thioester reductase-like protein [Saccharopolyspora antimicrobica]SFN81281.1 thioester reductase domain-containing protein [Saccharopolyspora antimicrobica]
MSLRSVLLTGVTGSLGSRLCDELLRRTSATIYCLVRAEDEAAAVARLSGLPYAASERVVAVAGDVRSPELGLGGRAWDALAETIGAVFHCAATVNLQAPYDLLAPTNVGGTRVLASLAARSTELTGRTCDFHFVSTLGVFINLGNRGVEFVDETFVPTEDSAGELGYPTTKVVAERELRAAAERGGLRLTVHRPGLITGDSRTGRTSDSDLLVPALQACLELGSVPDGAGETPADTVDTVARCIVELASRPAALGASYHLVRREPLPLMRAIDALGRRGHRLGTIPREQWWEMVQEHSLDSGNLTLAMMSEVSRYMFAVGRRTPRIRADATWAALTAAGVSAPPLDDALFDRVVGSLEADGKLAAPSETRTAVRI